MSQYSPAVYIRRRLMKKLQIKNVCTCGVAFLTAGALGFGVVAATLFYEHDIPWILVTGIASALIGFALVRYVVSLRHAATSCRRHRTRTQPPHTH